jgi:hypothetical protein
LATDSSGSRPPPLPCPGHEQCQRPQSHELIVGPDGSIPADQIARLGLRPGTHLRVVAEPGLGADDPARTSLAGPLRERIDDAALDRFDAALAANRRERIAAVEPA